MSETNCVIGSKPHTADVGYLCRHHLEDLGRILRDIEDEAVHLSAVPSMQQSSGSRGGTLASHRAPARLDVVVANDPRRGGGWSEDEEERLAAGELLSVLNTLHGWARVVREDRGLTPPDRVTVTGERDALSRNLAWVAGQPWVDDAYGDFRKLLGQLRASNGTRPDRPYSYCPSVVAGEQCIGQVWIRDELQPVWRRYTDRCAATWEQAPGSAACDTCGAVWVTSADKARLRKMIDDTAAELIRPRTEDGHPMRTAVEIAAEHGVKVGTIAVWAHRRNVVSVNGHYDPREFRDKATA